MWVCVRPSGARAGGMGRFSVWDYVVFAAMLLVSAAIGIYYAFAGGGQKTSKDFLMGGRSMSALPVALSLTASFMSAVTVLGTPAEIYRYGAIFCIFAITYALVVLCSAEIFLPVFYRLGITSTYEVRWSNRSLSTAFRELGALSGLLSLCLLSRSFPTPRTLCCSISRVSPKDRLQHALSPDLPTRPLQRGDAHPAAAAQELCTMPDLFPHSRCSV